MADAAKPEVTNLENNPVSANSKEGVAPDKGAVNFLLVLSCLAFGAGSFLFGYDDKVISPVAATPFFVSCALARSVDVSMEYPDISCPLCILC